MEPGYTRALERLHALARFGVRPGLEAITTVLAALGDPQRSVPALHIAGTNGKGSTAAIALSLLRATGARVGAYTSPHLVRFTERIRVVGPGSDRDGEIARATVADRIERVLAAPGGDSLTFFEVSTAAAFLHFAEERVDLAVIEVGLGGRLDATACCAPFATVITSIGLDHTAELGSTTAAIAVEKAGIARAGVPLLIGPMDRSAEAAVRGVAGAVGANVLALGRDLTVEPAGPTGLRYRGPGGPLDRAELLLRGWHQVDNAGLALGACAFAPRFAPDEAARRAGLAGARWPGRLEQLGDVLLDGAHNPEGAAALARFLGQRWPGGVTLLMGLLADKDAPGVLGPLLPHARALVCTRPDSSRALAPQDLAAHAARLAPTLSIAIEPNPVDALERGRAMATALSAPLIGCGSLYLVGALRALLTGELRDPVVVGDPMGVAAVAAHEPEGGRNL